MADNKVQVEVKSDGGITMDGEDEPAPSSIGAKHAKNLKKVAGARRKSQIEDAGESHHGHGAKEPSILTAIASAVINFLLMFGLCCAYGIIMFEDSWNAQHRGLGVKMNLCSALVMGLLLAFGSKMGVAIGGPDLNPVVFLGMFVQKISDAVAKDHGLLIPNGTSRRLLESCWDFDPLEEFRRLGASSSSTAEFCTGYHYASHAPECDKYHDELRATTIFAVSVSSLILGLLFFCLGRFRMTRLVTYVPTNIMEAFLSCVGYKVFKYALKFCKYKPQQFIPAMCVGVPLYFMKAMHVGNPAVVIPLVLFIPLGIFYAIVFGQGGNVETARSAGWMFDELQNADFWSVWTDSLGKTGDINFKAWTATLADLAVMIIVCLLDAMLKVSSTENKLPVEVDKDYEVQLYGVGNFLTTCCGASVGYMQLKFNVINFGVLGNTKDRRAGVLYALICGALFFWTTDLFNYLPRFFLSTLLFFAGSGFVAENLWGSRKYLSTAEWLQIFIILGVFIIANSLLYAVITGGLIAGGTFIFRYARIPCVIGRPMFGGEGKSTDHRTVVQQRKIQHVSNSWSLVIRLKGYIFFASAQKLTGWVLQHLAKQRNGQPDYRWIHYIIFDFSALDGLDSSASKAFGKVAKAAAAMNVVILWSGVDTEVVKQLKGCDVIENDSQLFVSLAQARQTVENEIKQYIMDQEMKWVELHPLFNLAYETMRDRMALEPFEDILKLDTARLGCPWQYCSRLKLRKFSTLIWQQGEKRRTLFLVHSGKVGLFERIPDDMAEENWPMPEIVYNRGQLLNKEALLHMPARMNAVALEDGELLCWSEVQWARMAREHPPMAAAIVQALMRQEDHTGPRHYKDHVTQWKTLSSSIAKAEEQDTEDHFKLDNVHAAASHLEELQPWLAGLYVTKGLESLGLFEPGAEGAGLRLTASMSQCLEKDLVTSFHTYKNASGGDDNKESNATASVPATKISEALMYAGLFGTALTEGQVSDLTQADFISLGREISSVRLSSQQVATLEMLHRKGVIEDGNMTRAAAARLLRENVSPGLTMEEVDDLVNLCGGASSRNVDSETFLAMMARLVRKHEREWCVLLGVRHLLGATEGKDLDERLTAEHLVKNGLKEGLTTEEAEEMLWCANICSEKGEGVDIRMVGLALWPCDVPTLGLPPPPRTSQQDAVPGSTSGDRARSFLADFRAPLANSSKPPRLSFSRADEHLLSRQTSAGTEEEDIEEEKEGPPDTCRAKLNRFLDEPQSSAAASHWSVVMGMCIMVSVLTLFLEPLVSPKDKDVSKSEKAVWSTFEVVFTMVFSVELLVRFSVADALGTQTFIGFLKTPMNICDLIAILPWYIDLIFASDQESFRLFRIVRLSRLARLVRLGRLAKRSAMFAPIAVILVVIWGIFMKSTL